MAIDIEKLGSYAFAFITLLIMLLFDWTWGRHLMSFTDFYTGIEGWILKLMITFTFGFGTIILPLMIFYGHKINPLNIVLGLGALLIGIPSMLFITQIIPIIIEITGITGELKVIADVFTIFLIIAIGFIMPIFVMLKEEPITEIIEGVGQ